MTPLRRRLIEDMKVRNLAPLTQETYLRQVSMFARHFRLLGGEHRTCANEYERKQLLYLRRRSLGQLECSELLSLFKCQQYLCADAVGVAQRHQAGRDLRPLVVPKVVILNAGGEDKEIVWYVVLLKANNALLRIDTRHFA